MKQITSILLLTAMLLFSVGCSKKDKQTESESQINGFYSGEKTEVASANQAKPHVKMMELPAPLTDRPEQILRRKGYTASYNRETTPTGKTSARTKSSPKTMTCRLRVPRIGITTTRATTADTCARQATTSGMPKPCDSRSSLPISVRRTIT